MATHLDLEEQEQLDQLKAFWNRWGNAITAVIVIAVGIYLGWLGWNAYQRDQGAKAGAMYDELDRAARSGNVDSSVRIFDDMKERYPRTTFTGQAGLLAAKAAAEKGQLDAARTSLAWVADNASEDAYRAVAHLRLAGILLDEKQYDAAIKQLESVQQGQFKALAADRRGDILHAEGKLEPATAAYREAWTAMDPKLDYRRVVEAKLNVLGANPQASNPGASGAAQ